MNFRTPDEIRAQKKELADRIRILLKEDSERTKRNDFSRSNAMKIKHIFDKIDILELILWAMEKKE